MGEGGRGERFQSATGNNIMSTSLALITQRGDFAVCRARWFCASEHGAKSVIGGERGTNICIRSTIKSPHKIPHLCPTVFF